MKLLVFSHAFGALAEQRFYAELEAATGWSVTMVVPCRSRAQHGEDDPTPRWPGLQAEVCRLEVIRPGDRTPLLYRSWLVKLLRAQAPDVIFVQHEPQSLATAQIYLANRVAGRRPIGFRTAQNAASQEPAPVGLIERWMERWVLRDSAFAFAATEPALVQLRAKGFAGPAATLPAALDLESFRPDPTRGAARRTAMRLAPGRVLYGYVGRLEERRGLERLLEAFKHLDGVPWELFLVGSGRLEGALRRKVLSSNQLRGHVHFVGQVARERMGGWLSLLDAVVLPSETLGSSEEPSGRVLLEALACGTPGVGSDAGEIPGVLQETGGGLLFRQGNTADLVAALRRMADEPALRQALAAAGGAAVARQFRREVVMGAFCRVLEQVLAKS